VPLGEIRTSGGFGAIHSAGFASVVLSAMSPEQLQIRYVWPQRRGSPCAGWRTGGRVRDKLDIWLHSVSRVSG
jgi:hypothetical protein